MKNFEEKNVFLVCTGITKFKTLSEFENHPVLILIYTSVFCS